MTTAQTLLSKWAAHLADVYERRGRADVYSLEVLHTCHGCGGGSGRIWRGLCEFCLAELEEAVRDPNPPTPTTPPPGHRSHECPPWSYNVEGEYWVELPCRVCDPSLPPPAAFYTKDEREAIERLRKSVGVPLDCQKCGRPWVNGYPPATRACPNCGHPKPWADPSLVEAEGAAVRPDATVTVGGNAT